MQRKYCIKMVKNTIPGTICGGVLDGFASYSLLHVTMYLERKKQSTNKLLKRLKSQIKSYKYNKI